MRPGITPALVGTPSPGMAIFLSDGIAREMTPLAARCMRNEALRHNTDLTGKRIGGLTVVCVIGETGGKLRWECRCDCGEQCFYLGCRLIGEYGPKSCGCLRRKNIQTVGSAQKGKHWKWSNVRKIRAKSRGAAA
jgi:hypothetical protein